ncbi:MAG: alpha/beta fold hydrolase, partial [Chloroflexi bacterium]|nr:alpha/beta fold hydrolase [Chloroflexota bacterium]
MSALKRALRIGGMTGLAITGYAAYAQYAIRRFEHLDPLNADAPGSYLDIDGTAIHYVEAGRGEDVVLIHGWNGSTFSFRYTIPELAQRYRVIAIDLMGYGYSARMRDADYSLT